MRAHLRLAAMLIAVFSFISLSAQTPRATLYITVKNSLGETRKGLEVSLSDKKTPPTATKAFTDANGKAEFNMLRNVPYDIKVNGKAAGNITLPTNGLSTVTKSITFEFEKVAIAKIDTVKFAPGEPVKATVTEGVAMVNVFSHGETPVKGVKVTLVSTKINKAFVAYSDEKGEAKMLVPLNNNYKMYTDDIEFGHTFEMPDIPYINKGLKIQYIPTSVTESASGDTVLQKQDDITEATADRVFIYFDITDMSGNLLANEPVYLNSTTSTKVYTATTSAAGRAKFLIPHGAVYNVNFKYERDVDQLDLTQKKGYRTIEIGYTYMGSANIEKYYDEVKRDKNGFRTGFMEMAVKPHKIHDNYLEKTATGFNLNLADPDGYTTNVASSPPAVSGDNLMVSGGYYSHNFYSFDKNTGTNRWGVELSDGGASATVSDSGVTLIITQSCTLYALDEDNGKPLWTKWLGSSMYSSPTVANGKVYAVYPDNLMTYGSSEKGEYVLACFSLKKGDVLWQHRLDGNVKGAPVCAAGKVYLTSQAGTVYAFEGAKGTKIASKALKAISPPTIMGGSVLVSTSKDGKTKDAALLDASLNIVKRLPGTSAVNEDAGSAINEMNNDEGRALAYKGKFYYIMGATVYCADATGKTVWSKPTAGEGNSMPVVAGGKIVVVTENGKVQLLSPDNGALVKQYDLGNPVFSQPVITNGTIYAATKTGKMNAYKTGDKTLDGWAMWGGNAGHNAVVE